jgi:hypothetical protein
MRSASLKYLVPLALLLLASRTEADGLMVGYDENMARWSLQTEESQLCLINHRDGVEHMLISVALSSLRHSHSAWILPVPASPESTTVAIYKGFPRLRGDDVVWTAQQDLLTAIALFGLTSVYPVPFIQQALFRSLLPRLFYAGAVGGVDDGGHHAPGIAVFSHEEAYGLTAELVSAETPGKLVDYLASKGTELPEAARPVLDSYSGDSFSFVVAWISDSLMFSRESIPTGGTRQTVRAVGLSLTFPTDRAYFPLRPTSVYGDRPVPLAVYVIGYVTPELYPGIRESTSVEYCFQNAYQIPRDYSTFFGRTGTISRLEYTVVDMNPQSSRLTADLRFNPKRPFKPVYATLIDRFWLMWMVLLILLVCCGSSLVAGWVALGRHRLRWYLQALFGLLHCLTALVFVVAAALMRFPERRARDRESAEPQRPAPPGRKIAFIVVFIVTSWLLLLLSWLALNAPLR